MRLFGLMIFPAGTINRRKGPAMEYKETHYISADALRSLCIANHWYTRGDNAAYQHLLFDLAENKKHQETSDIIEIARDIVSHSNLSEYGDADDVVGLVAYHVAKIATTRFVRVGE